MNLTAPAFATIPCPVPTQTPVVHVCDHCQTAGTTVCGALWRVSPATSHAACTDLYYLHTHCLAPYKAAHGLRSVEGRLPRVGRADAMPPVTPATRESAARGATPAAHAASMAIHGRAAL